MRPSRGRNADRVRVLFVAAPLALLFVLARAATGWASVAAWTAFFVAVAATIVWGIVETVRGRADFDDGDDGLG